MRFGSRPALALVFLSVLTACGGSGGDTTPVSPAPPPAAPIPPSIIGAKGGTVAEVNGATVVVPAGAIDTDTTIRIAMDSTGAPALPTGLGGAGNVYVITPHGGRFAQPVEVSLPAPNVTLQPNQELKLAKAQPGGDWEVQLDTTRVDGKLKAKVTSFSFFSAVVVTYLLPLAAAEPISFVPTITCGGQPCDSALGAVTATYTVVGNNGQLPCENGTVGLQDGYWYGRPGNTMSISRSGATVSRVIPFGDAPYYTFATYLSCPDRTFYGSFPWGKQIAWKRWADYPFLSVMSMPTQLDVVAGLQANLDVLLGGGAVRELSLAGQLGTSPTAADRATVHWQRSDDGGKSWREIARSYQDEANPTPFGTGLPWRPWGVRHGFIAAATDQGALIRVHACYTPAAPTAAPPCVNGPTTLINVLQTTSIPEIVTAPRSLLIRTAETASFSVTASGLPAPTLQWQTRPANSTGVWSNVALGAGGTSSSYTTAPRLPSNNGEQYRVVATNALGSTASAPVIVSVSDIDVAPTITTQPGSLTVTTGHDAVFAVVAYGTEAMSYQWRFNGAAIPGANSAVLRLTAVTGARAGNYSVAVSNSAGNAVSTAAVLSVTAATSADVAPTITQQPIAATVFEDDTATFNVSANGSNLQYQWLKDGASIFGANQASYTTPTLGVDGSGPLYRVIVFNAAGLVVSQSALLTVNSRPPALNDTTLVSERLGGGAPGFESREPSISSDGNLVAFISNAIDLVPGTTVNGHAYVRNVATGVTTLIDQTPAGAESSRSVQSLKLAAGGRYVIFTSDAGDLVSGDTNNSYDVFRRDLQTGTTIRLSVLSNGDQLPFGPLGNGDYQLDISADGSGVLFRSFYDITTDGSETAHPFLYHRAVNAGFTRRIAGSAQYASAYSALSDNGEWVVYSEGIPPPGAQSINLYDLEADQRYTMYDIDQSAVSSGLQREGLSVSNDGKYIAFAMLGLGGSTISQVYVVDRSNPGVLTLASTGTSGAGDGHSAYPRLSGNGRYVIFTSNAPNLTAGQALSSTSYLVVRDLVADTTTVGSRKFDGTDVPLNAPGDHGYAISGNGSRVTFVAEYGAVSGGMNAGSQVFVGPRP